jgi:hypothetical protein
LPPEHRNRPDVVKKGVKNGGESRADACLLACAGKLVGRQIPRHCAVLDRANIEGLVDAAICCAAIVDRGIKLVRVGVVALVDEIDIVGRLARAQLDILGGEALRKERRGA